MNNTKTKPPKHEIVSCPRCDTRFECKMGTITECQCMEVRLSPNQILAIREDYVGCLCKNCLEEYEGKL
ncbi:MAG: cysteine-rich CWC family protein [Leptospira sp.]|nr:cysteine-rich CWC family protein [Leptospira sp.]